jgi:thiol:disulfide interchange protein DsbD
MKLQILFLFTVLLSAVGFSQTKIQWEYAYNTESKTIEIQSTLADGWHLYSQHVANEIGPVPTSFVFEPNNAVKFIGKVNEPQPIQKYDENFEAMLDFFEGKVLFTQRLSVKESTTIQGKLTYMVCNDVMCLPPVDEKFTITITK